MSKHKKVEDLVNFETHESNPANTIPINTKLLIELLSIRAPSGFEDPVRSYIIKFIHEEDIKCLFDVDVKGNLYITKGDAEIYPCIVAHMDEVCGDETARTIVNLGNVLTGLNPQTGDPAGCPGDDRVGVYCALELLKMLPACKICFFVEEEIGARNGSGQAPLAYFRNCSFILQADRTENDEFITDSNGGQICSDKFISACEDLVINYNYEFSEYGSFTDCGVLSSRGVGISCVNLGAGYYDSHTCYEKVCITDVENVLNLMHKICLAHGSVRWENSFQDTWTSRYPGYTTWGGGLEDYDEPEYVWSDAWDAWIEKDEYIKDIESVVKYTSVDKVPCNDCKELDCKSCKLVVN